MSAAKVPEWHDPGEFGVVNGYEDENGKAIVALARHSKHWIDTRCQVRWSAEHEGDTVAYVAKAVARILQVLGEAAPTASRLCIAISVDTEEGVKPPLGSMPPPDTFQAVGWRFE